MLRRMADRKEVKIHELSKFGIPDMFMLPATNRLKSSDKFLHEQAGADLFVTYYPFMKRWAHEPFINSMRADRGLQLKDDGLTVYFEVDRITENIQDLRDKVDNYIQYSNHTKEPFHVIFAFVGTQEKVRRRGDKFIPYLKAKRRGDQFLIVNHEKLIADPFGQVLYSPRDEILSLSML